MKKRFLTFVLSVIVFYVNAQSFNNPESVAFDKSTGFYFVSNVGDSTILKVDKKDVVSEFVYGYDSFLGVKLHKRVLYCAENKKTGNDVIRGFDKENGHPVFSISIPNTKQLNDIEFDAQAHLYVTNRLNDKIYRIDLSFRKIEVIDSTIHIPNGFYFDKKNNRMLVCNTTGRSSIYSIDLDSGKKLVVATVNFSYFDGITMDNERNIYVTSWSKDRKSHTLYRVSSISKCNGKKFVAILKNNKGMADIAYNKKTHSIDIANYYDNSIMHFKLKR